jgi:hypothetical protein
MMDWITIAASLVGVLTWFVTKTGEGIAQKIGEEIYEFLKAGFRNDKEGATVLENFAKKPRRYKDVLAEIITDKAVADTQFGEKILVFYQKAQQIGIENNRIIQTASGRGIAQAADHASANVNISTVASLENDKKKKKRS